MTSSRSTSQCHWCLAIVIGLLIPVGMLAQSSPITGGSMTIGGTARINGFRDIGNDRRTFIIEVNPRVGYFVVKRLSVQANLLFSRFASQGRTNTSWGVGPGVTYYLGSAGGAVYPFVSVRSLFRWSRSPGANWWHADYLGGGGLVVMVSDHVGLVGEFSYQWGWTTVESSGRRSTNSAEQYGLRVGVLGFIFE